MGKKQMKPVEVQGVRGYVDKNNIAWLNVEDIARRLGFTEKAASGNVTIRWRTVRSHLESLGYQPSQGSCDDINGESYIPENMFYRLAMKASNDTAQAFQAKIADEILPEIRRKGFYSVYRNELDHMEIETEKMNDASDRLERARINLEYARESWIDDFVKRNLATAKLLHKLALATTNEELRDELIRQAAKVLTNEKFFALNQATSTDT